MRTWLAGRIRDYLADEQGISAPVVAMSIAFLLGMAGLSVDLGYAYATKTHLQAATNAAALAGAYFIGSATDPVKVATLYSAGLGDSNSNGSVVTYMTPGYPKLLCLANYKTNQGVACVTGTAGTYPTGGANAIRVIQTARSPTFFAGIFGWTYIPITATATASAHGGAAKPLDIAIIIDTTGSMGSTDSACGLGASATRVQCAESGVKTLLLAMNPTVASVQLLAFPGFPSQAQANQDWLCAGATPTIVPYWTSGIVYTVNAAMVNDYNTGGSSPTLKPGSNIVKAIGGGGTGCTGGLQTPGGEGTYYAGAITAAQAALVADGHDTRFYQEAMILLSDGEANATNNTVTGVNITSGGSGYTTAPTVTIANYTGSQGTLARATATATITGGVVTGVTITNGGGGYLYNLSNGAVVPTVTFSAPPTGTGHTTATGTVVLSSVPGTNQCSQAVTAANAAKAAGTWVFVVAYGSSTNTADCTTDWNPAISACTALEQIATSTDDFWSDGSGGVTCPTAQPVTNLAAAFAAIAAKITKVRLVPNDTT